MYPKTSLFNLNLRRSLPFYFEWCAKTIMDEKM
jgi:hypothetical protein